MGPKQLLNKIIRVCLLTCLGVGLLIYLIGVVANVFGLLDLKAPIAKVEERIASHGGYVDTVRHDSGFTVYAAVDSEREAAVFHVHGSPGSLDAYLGFLEDQHLQAHSKQFTYDRLGYGDSRPLEAVMTLEEHANQLSTLIRHVGAEKNVLTGHSLGCTIAAYLAAKEPELVDGMVLISAPLDPALEPSSWWRPMLDFPVITFAIPHSMRISNRELIPIRHELMKCIEIWDRITCPVTFIHGRNDRLVPIENLDFAKKYFVNSERLKETIIENEGHFILWTHEELITDEIIQLIESIE